MFRGLRGGFQMKLIMEEKRPHGLAWLVYRVVNATGNS
jgi:hypothetical protein